ncbi:sensor histidine kinase [Streptomyces vietnamensis]|uniref:sensor histidine kinase n=1 Tax=Streptomyces vietnamensis TaxID=362257 RepID=UPI000A8AE094|nr:sensor histidine kinase [Streptomyces vietnamensis]
MASVIALLFSSAEIRTPVAWCGLAGVLLTVATSAIAARRTRAAEAQRHTRARVEAAEQHAQREAALLTRLDDQRTTVAWLAEELLPAAVARLQKGDSSSEILRAVTFGKHIDPDYAEALREALRTSLEAVEAEENTRDASQRALVAIARRVQAIVHQLAKDLHAMQILHGNDLVVSRGLQEVDHRNALIGRLAASVAVLGDARPGRQWSKAIPLYDVLRGAMSRIVDFPRVKLTSIAEVAVIGPGAEPLMHLLAELLDNATTFSPPHTPVEVTASEVPTGIAIEIEDRGIGLTEEVRQRVERVMAQSQTGVNLSGLGELTQIGLPVVSRLARQHGCDVDLRISAYGGVRAVVLVPRDLITTVPPSALKLPQHARRRTGGPVLPRPTPAPDATAESVEVRKTANGLPQRRRESPGPALPQRRRESPVPIPIVQTGPAPSADTAASRGTSGRHREPGLMWEAFNADRGDRSPVAAPSLSPSEPSDEDE